MGLRMSYSRFILMALFLCVSCCATNAYLYENPQTEQAAKQQAEKYHLIYQQLVERAKKGDITVDYVQMIAASMDWDTADKYQTEPPHRDEMVAAFKAR